MTNGLSVELKSFLSKFLDLSLVCACYIVIQLKINLCILNNVTCLAGYLLNELGPLQVAKRIQSQYSVEES